jgi:hypothetical protein
MAGHQDVWRTEPDGVLAAEVGTYRLIVQAPEHTGGSVRFMVLRRENDDGALALIGSGMKADLRTAMKAAARMADSLIGKSSVRHDRSDPYVPRDAIVAAGRL